MTFAPQSDKSKRRSTAVHLTENEIENFLAHSDDEENESDWDDLGEADLSAYLSSLDPTPTAPSKLQSTKAAASTSRKDIGVDALFGSNPSNTVDESSTTTGLDVSALFGPNSSGDEDGGHLDAEDEDHNISLSEQGALIQKSLNSSFRKQRSMQIDREVEQHIYRSSPETPVTSALSKSVSSNLAACTARRQQVLSNLHQAQSVGTSSLQPHLPVDSAKPSTSHVLGDTDNSHDGWIVKPTKLRVFRSRISSELWTSRTASRQVLSLTQFIQRQRTQSFLTTGKQTRSNASEDLVTVGVIGSKLPPRRSKNDRIYSVWCLSDLEHVGPGSTSGCVKLFLFGECHEKLWKEPDGNVVAILSPRILSDSMTSSNEKDLGITLQSSQHVMILGQSPDFGICAATSKSGQSCFHVINKTLCRFCDMHVKKAYFQASSSRPGFFDSNLSNLNRRPTRRYTGDVPPIQTPGVYCLPTSNMLAYPSDAAIGSSARVKLSVTKLTAAGYSVDSSSGLGSSCELKTASNLAAHPTATENSISKASLNNSEEKLLKALCRPTAGSLNLLRHLESDDQRKPTATSIEGQKQNLKRTHSETNHRSDASKFTFSEFFSSMRKQNFRNKPKSTPEFIDLGPMPSASPSTAPILSQARLRASALIKSRGGIAAMDATYKEARDKERDVRLTQALKQANTKSPLTGILNPDKTSDGNAKRTDSQLTATDGQENSDPQQTCLKRQRLKTLAEKVRQGSAHANLVGEVEKQTEDSRLAVLQQRDEFAQKLADQMEEKCTYVRCKTCDYRAWKAAADCRSNQHALVYVKGTKRYYKCRNCSKRTVTFERYPTVACTNCGESLFEKTTILRERDGPDLPGEKLLPRGVEQKFLG